MGIGKTFDLLDHQFLIAVLTKYEFGQNVITRIKILFYLHVTK